MKRYSVFFFIIFFIMTSVFAENVFSGRHGIVRTVISGNMTTDIKVSILNTFFSKQIEFENTAPSCEVFIIKSLDENGFVSGCSGSPLIVDNNIIGSVSYAFSGNKNKYAVVLPIDTIKETLGKVSPEFPAIGFNLKPENNIFIDSSSEFVLRNIEKNLGLRSISIPANNSLYIENENSDIIPGSAVMIGIVSGDINMSVLGTITDISGGRVYALGHRAFGKGPVNYFLQNAYIIDTLYDEKGGYKIGVNGKIKGMIYYDSNFGVVGEIGKFPLIIPLNIEFSNRDDKERFSCHIVKNNDILLKTFDSILYHALDRHIEKKQDLSISVDIGFEESGFNLRNIKIENIFFKSENDMEAMISSKIMNIIRLLSENPFINLKITKVNIKVESLENKRKILYFRNIELNNRDIVVKGIVKGESDGKIIIRTDINLKNSKNDLSLIRPDLPEYSECRDFEDLLNRIKDIEYDIVLKIRNNDNIIIQRLNTEYYVEDFQNEFIF